MALILLLRGVNVGGHRRFRPKLLAHELSAYDAVNIGAAGTLVLRKPGPRTQLRALLLSKLPETTRFVLCDGRELLKLSEQTELMAPLRHGAVRFVSFLESSTRKRPSLPVSIPAGDDWFVRVTSVNGRLAVGEYRRHMRTISCLAQLDTLFGTLVTTRSASTIKALLQVLTQRRQQDSDLRGDSHGEGDRHRRRVFQGS